MARLVQKKKGYNVYLRYARFSGYGLHITLEGVVAPDGDTVTLYFTQEEVPGHVDPPRFFEPKDLRLHNHNVALVVGLRRIRYMAEQLVQADFELLNSSFHNVRMVGKPLSKPKKPRIRK